MALYTYLWQILQTVISIIALIFAWIAHKDAQAAIKANKALKVRDEIDRRNDAARQVSTWEGPRINRLNEETEIIRHIYLRNQSNYALNHCRIRIQNANAAVLQLSVGKSSFTCGNGNFETDLGTVPPSTTLELILTVQRIDQDAPISFTWEEPTRLARHWATRLGQTATLDSRRKNSES